MTRLQFFTCFIQVNHYSMLFITINIAKHENQARLSCDVHHINTENKAESRVLNPFSFGTGHSSVLCFGLFLWLDTGQHQPY